MSAANNYIEEIKNAKIIREEVLEDTGIVTIGIKVFGEEFYESAYCNQEDLKYFSPKIGCTLSHMRAMRSALVYKIGEIKTRYDVLHHVYGGITSARDPHEVDPTGKFKLQLDRYENQYHELVQAKRSLDKEITMYIKDIGKAIDSMSKNI